MPACCWGTSHQFSRISREQAPIAARKMNASLLEPTRAQLDTNERSSYVLEQHRDVECVIDLAGNDYTARPRRRLPLSPRVEVDAKASEPDLGAACEVSDVTADVDESALYTMRDVSPPRSHSTGLGRADELPLVCCY
jgi:hypothetical protein